MKKGYLAHTVLRTSAIETRNTCKFGTSTLAAYGYGESYLIPSSIASYPGRQIGCEASHTRTHTHVKRSKPRESLDLEDQMSHQTEAMHLYSALMIPIPGSTGALCWRYRQHLCSSPRSAQVGWTPLHESEDLLHLSEPTASLRILRYPASRQWSPGSRPSGLPGRSKSYEELLGNPGRPFLRWGPYQAPLN